MLEKEFVLIIPEFLLRRIYRKGSLRMTDEGIEFDLKNMLGPGVISGISFIEINGKKYDAEAIKLMTSEVSTLASKISKDNPVVFRLHQEGTVLLEGARELKEGINKIILELVSREAGKVQVSLNESFSPA